MGRWVGRPSGTDGRGVQRHGGAGVPGPGHRPPADDRPAGRDRGAGLPAVRGASRGGVRPDRPGALDPARLARLDRGPGLRHNRLGQPHPPPHPPSLWLARERDADIAHRFRWMLRVVDAPAAIAARGFPVATTLSVPLRIADDARPANSGCWQLSVAGGAGRLDPLGPDAPAGTASPGGTVGLADSAVMLGARGLAALYAGTPLVTLRQAGLADGGRPDDDAALDAAFAATPYMLDAF